MFHPRRENFNPCLKALPNIAERRAAKQSLQNNKNLLTFSF